MEVLICAYGNRGLERIARANHPRVDGVRYTVCCQRGEEFRGVPEELQMRGDMRVLLYDDSGISRNRNHSLDVSEDDILLLGDDDVEYTSVGLKSVIRAFEDNPERDFLTFQYSTDDKGKTYSPNSFDWRRPAKGSYPASIEMAFRRKRVVGYQRFDERFGIGGDFCCGEEELFMDDMLRRGLSGCYLPLTICHHPGLTTSGRVEQGELIRAKGAVMMMRFRYSWWLRMLTHAYRSERPIEYVKWWMRGVRDLHRLEGEGEDGRIDPTSAI